MSTRLSTSNLARMSAHRPWRVVIVWIVALVAFGAVQGAFPLQSTTDVTLLNNPESVRGWDLLIEHGVRAERAGTETVIVRSEGTTVDDPAFQTAVQGVTDALRADPEVVVGATNYFEVNSQNPQAAQGLVSQDRTTTLIPVTLEGSLDEAVESGDDFLHLIDDARAGAAGFEVLTVGDASLNHEINEITEEDLLRGEGIGAGLAFVILIVVFGALVAALVPIILAIFAIAISFGLAALVSQIGELSFFVTNMITMIGLAVGIDYSLFVVERYREERRRGAPKLSAILIAGSTASRAVLFSGLTVIFAVAGLFIVPNNIFRSLSVGAILVVLVAVLATLTLLPALIGLLGDKLDWPRKRNYDDPTAQARQAAWDHETMHAGFWGGLTRLVMARPVISMLLAVGLLVICAIPYFDLKPGLNFASSLPDELESKQAYDILVSDFSAGLISPVEIVVDGPADDPTVQQGIAEIQTALGGAQQENGQPLFGPASTQTSPDNAVTLISVPMNVDPDAPAGFDAIERLRGEILPPIEGAMNGTEVLVSGVTANNFDFLEMRDTYTPIVFAFVLGLSFILLLVVFRSIVIPATAILMNLLSVGAAYGLIVWVFQEGNLSGFFGFQQIESIEAWLPLFLFSVLFGLSMDYHVFLLSRIKEHYDLSGRNAESVAVGLQATARIITGAALIMVAVFGGFASGRLVFLQQMGFGLGVAVLLDATVVRSILVPSVMTILGDRNWYLPSWLNWLPNLQIEGGAREEVPAASAAPGAD